MSWRTNSAVLALRKAGRKIGLNDLVASLIQGPRYEDRYDKAFSDALAPGDCVWDVGANVGHYTKAFSGLVGAEGAVVAFEPSPINFARLESNTSDLSNVRRIQVGLGEEDGSFSFEQGEDSLGATSRVLDGESERGIQVTVHRGSRLIDGGEVQAPNALKVDVEGFEIEVLKGMGSHLKRPELRLIGVEVHFGILAERGLVDGPRQLEQLIQEAGFTISWPDPSHMVALRLRP